MWGRNLIEALSRKKSPDYDDNDDDDAGSHVDSGVYEKQSTPGEESHAGYEKQDDTGGGAGGRHRKPQEKETTAPGGTAEKLTRVLGLTDLTLLGIGSTLGLGVYILGGAVAKNQAGPGVIFSLVLAAVASGFSALCYVEFASRIFKAGSAYNYTYLSIGEFAAYVIGWNLVLEYVISTACEAKAISTQIDALMGNVYQQSMESIFPINNTFLSTYPDFIAATIVLLMSGLISYGVQESTRINSVLTFCNLGTVLTIVVSGLFKINLANWTIARKDIPARYKPTAGAGGFLPFGLNGVMVGAAKCFFGFVGFDAIATTGEEAKNPRRNIPLSILLSLSVVFVCYVAIAIILTLIIPYYEQDADAPFPHIFDVLGWPFMKWLVSVGSLFALMTGMFGALFPLPRILYSMARDGLVYPSFAYVSPRTQTPIVSSLATGILTAILSAIFKLDQLVDMLCIGTLLAYTIVSLSVLIIRYSDEDAEKSRVACTWCSMDAKSFTLKPFDTIPHINIRPDEPSPICKVNNEKATLPLKLNSSDDTVLQVYEVNTIVQQSDVTSTTCDANLPYCETNLERYEDASNFKVHRCESKLPSYGKSIPLNEGDNVKLPYKPMNGTAQFVETNVIPHHCEDSKSIPLRCKHRIGFLNRFRTLFNLNSASPSLVTPTSQCISKVCIYLFICLTVIVCLVLNAVTGVDLNLDSAPPPLTNQTSPDRIIPFVLEASNSSVVRGAFNGNSLKRELFGENRTSLPDTVTSFHLNASHVLMASSLNSSTVNRVINSSYVSSFNGIQSSGSADTFDAVNGFGNIRALANPDGISATVSEKTNSTRVGGSANLFASWDVPPSVQAVAYVCLGILYIGTFLVLGRQAQNVKRLNFRVPLVPLIPCLSIFLNIYLMVNLDSSTWVRFIVWMIVGLFIYFSYGISHSKQTKVTKVS